MRISVGPSVVYSIDCGDVFGRNGRGGRVSGQAGAEIIIIPVLLNRGETASDSQTTGSCVIPEVDRF